MSVYHRTYVNFIYVSSIIGLIGGRCIQVDRGQAGSRAFDYPHGAPFSTAKTQIETDPKAADIDCGDDPSDIQIRFQNS